MRMSASLPFPSAFRRDLSCVNGASQGQHRPGCCHGRDELALAIGKTRFKIGLEANNSRPDESSAVLHLIRSR
jgi:hypothetical protein